jgi:hypothetical protein
MNTLVHLQPKQLRRAADLQERILKLQDELTEILGAPAEAPASEAPAAPKNGRRKRKKLSPQALANIRAAQAKRWAKVKGGKAASANAKTKPRKRFSVATRKRMAERMKARWAARRAAGKKSL